VPTSASIGAAADRGPSSDSPSLLKRLAGVVHRPAQTFRAVIERPSWVDVLAVTTLLSVVVSGAFAGTSVGRLALLDGIEQVTYSFGHEMTDAAYAVVAAIVVGPVLAVAVAGAAYGAAGRRAATRPTFRQVFAVVVHAGAILAIRQVLAAPLSYLKETAANPMSLVNWLPVDSASPLARVLGLLDVFVIWWAIVLAVGLAILFRKRARPLALALVGAYAGLSLLVAIAAAAVTGRTA
jgi:hypothetical protein